MHACTHVFIVWGCHAVHAFFGLCLIFFIPPTETRYVSKSGCCSVHVRTHDLHLSACICHPLHASDTHIKVMAVTVRLLIKPSLARSDCGPFSGCVLRLAADAELVVMYAEPTTLLKDGVRRFKRSCAVAELDCVGLPPASPLASPHVRALLSRYNETRSNVRACMSLSCCTLLFRFRLWHASCNHRRLMAVTAPHGRSLSWHRIIRTVATHTHTRKLFGHCQCAQSQSLDFLQCHDLG
jgi:hypothetical protein